MQSHGPSGTDQSRSSAFSRSRATQMRNTKTDKITIVLSEWIFKRERFVFPTRSTSIINPSSDHIERSGVYAMDCLLCLLLLTIRPEDSTQDFRNRRQGKELLAVRPFHFSGPQYRRSSCRSDAIIDHTRRIIQNGWAKPVHLSQTGDKSPAEV